MLYVCLSFAKQPPDPPAPEAFLGSAGDLGGGLRGRTGLACRLPSALPAESAPGSRQAGTREGSWRIVQVAPWTQPCTEESSTDPAVCAAAKAALADKALAELPGQIQDAGEELGYLKLTRPEGGENDSTQAHVTVYDRGMLCCLENLDGAPRVWYQLREPPELRVLFDAAAVETPAE